jgi:adenylate kinase family enzyme
MQRQNVLTSSASAVSSFTMPIDKLVMLDTTDQKIPYKPSAVSRSLRVVVITSNPKKFEEFRTQLGDGYGIDVEQWIPQENADLNDEQVFAATCAEVMAKQKTSPHFILREETHLTSRKNNKDLTHLPLDKLAELKLESVLHTSSLVVYKPVWETVGDASFSKDEVKVLKGFTARQYEKRSYGYIKRDLPNFISQHGFGWDCMFVNAATNLTNEEFFDKYGKKSARQHAVSDFIETYLRYKVLKSLEHHELKLTKPIDFGENYVSFVTFINGERYLSNPFVAEWGIEKLRNAMINQGLFFKAAWSRPVKNYFSPPFSGLPLTEKKDQAEETIFMTHDMLHHLVCDLICDAPASKENLHIYSAWRMLSESTTLILADMLYADGLIKSGVERTCVDKRIYPLFEAVKKAQHISDPLQMTSEARMAFTRRLLFANARYALLGDDTEWKNLLRQSNGDVTAEHLQRLEAYKSHFGKFFIGDNAWTRANFDNMQVHKEALDSWIESVGKDTFRKSHIPLLSDVSSDLRKRNVKLDQYDQLIPAIFDYMFDTKIKPSLEREKVEFDDGDLLQSRAFRRFLIGQASIFSRYPTPLNLHDIRTSIFTRLQDDSPFTKSEQDQIRLDLEQYILGIEGLRLMSREEALNAIDCTPVFSPVYISYPQMQKKYQSIENCVNQCIVSYAELNQQDAVDKYVRAVDGITFIDVLALEGSIGKSVQVKDRLRQKMISAGVEFWDKAQTIVKKPVVAISAIGSFLVCLEGYVPQGMIKLRMGKTTIGPLSPKMLADGLREAMGVQSFHTFMNPQSKTAHEMYDVTVKLGHLSIAHGASLGVHVLGISKKAELEFDVQRDLVHLARETSARTAAQDEPTLVAMTAQGAAISETIRGNTLKILQSFKSNGNALDWREERNSLYPLSGAVSLGINGSIRNLGKVVTDIGGEGKELEYRNVLALLNDSLHALLPEIFKSTQTYGYVNPSQAIQKSPLAVDHSADVLLQKKSGPIKHAVLLLGAPGVGKSTQTARIIKQLPGVMCVSTGNLVRRLNKKIEDNLPLNRVEKKAAESLNLMKQGKLMDDQAVYALLMAHLSPGGEGYQEYSQSHTIILDGVIKTSENIKSFELALRVFNAQSASALMSINQVINISASSDELVARHKARVAKAEADGIPQRPDDHVDVYCQRLSNYMHNAGEVSNYYNVHNKFVNVDSSQGIEKTTTGLIAALAKDNINIVVPNQSALEEKSSCAYPFQKKSDTVSKSVTTFIGRVRIHHPVAPLPDTNSVKSTVAGPSRTVHDEF